MKVQQVLEQTPKEKSQKPRKVNQAGQKMRAPHRRTRQDEEAGSEGKKDFKEGRQKCNPCFTEKTSQETSPEL